MLLHESLAELARDHGHGLFYDATAFRGSLDDYLEESQASSGTINLLTDAVRLGALDALVSMLDSGANAADAVDSAGQRLARDRGSADVRGCQWALAVLGFALGKVPEALAAGLDPDSGTALPPGYGATGAAPPPSVSPVRPPQQPIQSPPPPAMSPPTTFAQPGQQPGQQPSGPVNQGYPGGGYPAAPAYPGAPSGAWTPASAPKKKRTGLIVTALAVVLLLIAGGVIAAIALTGGDDDKKDDTTASKSNSQGDDKTLDGTTVTGTGYKVTLLKGWTDSTDAYLSDNPGGAGTLDRMILWGDTTSSARANIIIEKQSSYGETDPDALKDNWKNALTGGDSSVNINDILGHKIDGQSAIAVSISRTNDSGREISQRSYLVINGEKAYSITLSWPSDEDDALQKFEDILHHGWKWED